MLRTLRAMLRWCRIKALCARTCLGPLGIDGSELIIWLVCGQLPTMPRPQDGADLDSDASSWLSDFIEAIETAPSRSEDASTSKQVDDVQPKKARKSSKSGKRKKSKKARAKRGSSADSSSGNIARRAEGVTSSCSMPTTSDANPDDGGRFVWEAYWQPGSSPPLRPPSRGRAVAKMLIRAGLRCHCHFKLRHECPDRALSQS